MPKQEKRFDNPHKLGFMRFLQIWFALGVIVSISSLVFAIKGEYELDIDEIVSLLNVVFDAISFWLIWKRKAMARYFIIAFSLFNILVGTCVNIAFDGFNPLNLLLGSAFDIVLVIYFSVSRRAKAVLTQPFSAELVDEDVIDSRELYQPRTWRFWRNLGIYFCVFSVVGHWMEAAYCTLIRFGLIPGIYDPNSQIWSDWLYPFVVYGFGAVACVLLLFPVKTFLEHHLKMRGMPLLCSFLFNAFVCTLIEFVMGMMLNQPVDGVYPLWDYSDMFCNFMGQVCLQNALAFGAVATLMTWVLYPLMEKGLARLSNDVANTLFVVVVVVFLILNFFYCINVPLPSPDETDTIIQTEHVTVEVGRIS